MADTVNHDIDERPEDDISSDDDRSEAMAPAACPLCEYANEDSIDQLQFCEACGCRLVEPSPSDHPLESPPAGVVHRKSSEQTVDGVDPYRSAPDAPSLDVVVRHRKRSFTPSVLSFAAFFFWIAMKPAVLSGLAAIILGVAVVGIALSLVPRPTHLCFVVRDDSLTVVPDGVPLHRGQRFEGDAIEGIFVRALARAERDEDRRLELLLVDRRGQHHTLLRGIDEPEVLAWIATNLEQSLGFEYGPD